MKSSMDCLFLHSVTRTRGMCYFPIMPMGMFSMADFLSRNGIPCGIMNMGTEYSLNPNFSILSYLNENPARYVAIDLHWYVHAYSAIELARTIKEYDRTIKTVLGGFTASFFDMEILSSFPFIDYVIRGEGEIPLLELINQPGKNPQNVPNLTFRKNGRVVRSEKFVSTPQDVMDSLSFSNLPLMKHWKEYAAECAASSAVSYSNLPCVVKSLFYLSVGRGCGYTCSNCGGSAKSYRMLNQRTGPVIRQKESILSDIKKLLALGVESLYFEFDPMPAMEDYYINLFKSIRENKIDMSVNFALWNLPTNRFIDAFAKTFDLKRSCLCFSLKSGSEKVRALNKNRIYSNEEFMGKVKYMCGKGIYVAVHFKIGVPGETRESFNETAALFRRLKKFPVVLSAHLLHAEPGSPMFMEPHVYKITMFRKTFADYYSTFREWALGRIPAHPVGYETDAFSEKELVKLKLKAYRLFHLRPNYLLNRTRRVKNFAGVFRSFKLFLSVLLGIPSILLKEEKT